MIRALPLAAVALTLAGCHSSSATRAGAQEKATEASALPTMPCALDGAGGFDDACTVERIASDRGWTLVVHHPDGGFRRLTVTTDGRGVVAADGALPASVAVVDPQTIEVAVGGDRYRLPATIKGGALPAQ